MSNQKVAFLLLLILFTLPFYACSGDTSSASSPAGDIMGNLIFFIRDEYGNALSGAKVVSQNSPVNQLKVTGITGTDGMVRFNGIKAGYYEFQISRFDYEPQEVDAAVSAGVDNTITVTLQKVVVD